MKRKNPDVDFRALERRHLEAPEDDQIALAFVMGLVRTGRVEEAVTVLARVIERRETYSYAMRLDDPLRVLWEKLRTPLEEAMVARMKALLPVKPGVRLPRIRYDEVGPWGPHRPSRRRRPVEISERARAVQDRENRALHLFLREFRFDGSYTAHLNAPGPPLYARHRDTPGSASLGVTDQWIREHSFGRVHTTCGLFRTPYGYELRMWSTYPTGATTSGHWGKTGFSSTVGERRRNPDESLRALERAVLTGEPGALKKLFHVYHRFTPWPRQAFLKHGFAWLHLAKERGDHRGLREGWDVLMERKKEIDTATEEILASGQGKLFGTPDAREYRLIEQFLERIFAVDQANEIARESLKKHLAWRKQQGQAIREQIRSGERAPQDDYWGRGRFRLNPGLADDATLRRLERAMYEGDVEAGRQLGRLEARLGKESLVSHFPSHTIEALGPDWDSSVYMVGIRAPTPVLAVAHARAYHRFPTDWTRASVWTKGQWTVVEASPLLEQIAQAIETRLVAYTAEWHHQSEDWARIWLLI